MEPSCTGGLNRLTTAVDATARAIHHFNEVITVLVDTHTVENFFQPLISAVDNADADIKLLTTERFDRHRDRGFNDGVVIATDDFNVGVLKFFTRKCEISRTKCGFHHAARATKDCAGTCVNFKRLALTGLRFKQRIDTFAAHQFSHVASCERRVNVLEGGSFLRNVLVGDEITPCRIHFRTCSFKDLGRAWRDGNKVNLAGVALENVLGSPGLGERTTHLQRGLGR